MSFWGCALAPGKKVAIEENAGGQVLHLSQACLHAPQDGKNFLQVVEGNQTYAIACLQKGKSEYASFDLFFRAGSCSFVNKGASEIHLTGYFEPDGMGDDEGEESEEDMMEDDEEEESEEEAPPPAKKKK
eukprot:TRINITY_DN41953_c0_g1_i1.p2 TRINITY_DN41953_c0_g1~~TRINITY_DN41953_c0_g1_i1.p2  ORF type:complete len:130 (+),score=52.36 TRINITY_DN41953_c0_g1_i1:76-465(+)